MREGFYGWRVPLVLTDFAMGRVTDRVPTYWERMFLPQYLREAVDKLWGMHPIAIYTREASASARARRRTERPVPVRAVVIIALTSPAWITRLVGRFQRTGMAVAVVPYVSSARS